MDLFKGLLIFGVGAAIGSAVTYFMVKETLEAQAKSEMDSFYEFYENKMEKIPQKENSEKVDEKKEEPEEQKSNVFEEYSSIVDSYTKKEKEYTNYSAYSSEDTSEDEKTAHPDDKSEEPYLIEQYLYNEDEDYDKKELYYYDGNGVLVTEDENQVDILEYIGSAGSYELQTFNEPMIWVRNDAKETDFVVTRLYSSYNGME